MEHIDVRNFIEIKIKIDWRSRAFVNFPVLHYRTELGFVRMGQNIFFGRSLRTLLTK